MKHLILFSSFLVLCALWVSPSAAYTGGGICFTFYGGSTAAGDVPTVTTTTTKSSKGLTISSTSYPTVRYTDPAAAKATSTIFSVSVSSKTVTKTTPTVTSTSTLYATSTDVSTLHMTSSVFTTTSKSSTTTQTSTSEARVGWAAIADSTAAPKKRELAPQVPGRLRNRDSQAKACLAARAGKGTGLCLNAARTEAKVSSVGCTVTAITSPAPTTKVSTAATQTITVQPLGRPTILSTSTVKSVKTIYKGSKVQTVKTVFTTKTLTASAIPLSLTTQTFTRTVNVVVHAPQKRIYAACASDNLMTSPSSGEYITDVCNDTGDDYHFFKTTQASSAEECCGQCQQRFEDCVGTVFYNDGSGFCALLKYGRDDTSAEDGCPADGSSLGKKAYYLTSGSASGKVASNGPCAQIYDGGSK